MLILYGADAMEAREEEKWELEPLAGTCFCKKVEFAVMAPADKVILCYCL